MATRALVARSLDIIVEEDTNSPFAVGSGLYGRGTGPASSGHVAQRFQRRMVSVALRPARGRATTVSRAYRHGELADRTRARSDSRGRPAVIARIGAEGVLMHLTRRTRRSPGHFGASAGRGLAGCRVRPRKIRAGAVGRPVPDPAGLPGPGPGPGSGSGPGPLRSCTAAACWPERRESARLLVAHFSRESSPVCGEPGRHVNGLPDGQVGVAGVAADSGPGRHYHRPGPGTTLIGDTGPGVRTVMA